MRGDVNVDLKNSENLISYQDILAKKPKVTEGVAAKEAGDFAREIVKRKNIEKQKKQETEKKENLETEKPEKEAEKQEEIETEKPKKEEIEEEKVTVQLSEALVDVIASPEGTSNLKKDCFAAQRRGLSQ